MSTKILVENNLYLHIIFSSPFLPLELHIQYVVLINAKKEQQLLYF